MHQEKVSSLAPVQSEQPPPSDTAATAFSSPLPERRPKRDQQQPDLVSGAPDGDSVPPQNSAPPQPVADAKLPAEDLPWGDQTPDPVPNLPDSMPENVPSMEIVPNFAAENAGKATKTANGVPALPRASVLLIAAPMDPGTARSEPEAKADCLANSPNLPGDVFLIIVEEVKIYRHGGVTNLLRWQRKRSDGGERRGWSTASGQDDASSDRTRVKIRVRLFSGSPSC
jgi:hypothetical protein